MEFWITFWTIFMIITITLFIILVVVVAVGGFFNILSLFKNLGKKV